MNHVPWRDGRAGTHKSESLSLSVNEWELLRQDAVRGKWDKTSAGTQHTISTQ